MDRIEVLRGPVEGFSSVDGFGRWAAFDTESVRIGETRVDPGAGSPWHHHGRRTLYGFVVTGELVLEFGPGGTRRVRPVAGQFFRIPPGLVHRDVNPARGATLVVNVILGEGPATTDVDGPEE